MSSKVAAAAASYSFPSFHSFPPLYTRQVNEETRLKQLQQWSEIILGFCRDVQVHTFDLNEALTWRLFNNTAIQRKLSLAFAQEIIQQLVTQGNAQWEDATKTRCLIIWRTPEQWAALIEEWVSARGMSNTVVTLYELQYGEDTQATSFHKLETPMLMKALEALQKRGKAQIFQVDQEMGVKFF